MKMKKRYWVLIGVGIIILVMIVFSVKGRNRGVIIEKEEIARRDLTAIVSASGQVKAKKTVNISANSMGTITSLAVKEGDYVQAGQFLLRIDPVPLELQLERLKASLKAAKSSYEIAKANYDKALSNASRISELYNKGLQSKEMYENAMTALQVAEKELQAAKLRINQEEAQLKSASHDLEKVTIVAPISGLVTRLNVEEGENVIMGTMNNPGTVIMTISDMSEIEVELEVDETDVVDVRIGQYATVTLDAYPDKKFKATVTEIGNSPISTTATLGTTEAVNFKVVVTLNEKVEGVRPGFSATAEIITAKWNNVLSVPIQALVSREVLVGDDGKIIRQSKNEGSNKNSDKKYKKKEMEGVFVIKGDKVEFTPIKTGIVGESYFEVLSGLKEKDEVVIGPYKVLRELKDGDKIQVKKQEVKKVKE
jgi:HlyD family secretion protein